MSRKKRIFEERHEFALLLRFGTVSFCEKDKDDENVK
jgi:hypothetical protein